MRLIEIDNRLRKEKHLIDKLFAKYTLSPSWELSMQISAKISLIYPTGYKEFDAAMSEYLHVFNNDTFKRLL